MMQVDAGQHVGQHEGEFCKQGCNDKAFRAPIDRAQYRTSVIRKGFASQTPVDCRAFGGNGPRPKRFQGGLHRQASTVAEGSPHAIG
jgi:hypothetical protein